MLYSYLKKENKAFRFEEIALRNNEVVGDILKEAEKLVKAGKDKDADRLIAIAKKLLDNNEALKLTVGEVLSEIG